MQVLDNQSILDRINLYISEKNISVRRFETEIGVGNGTIRKALDKTEGKDKSIGSDKIEKILSTYKDINPIWLLTGEGNMLNENREATEPLVKYDSRVVPIEYGDKIIPLSLVPVLTNVVPQSAVAGYGSITDITQIETEVKLLPGLSFRPQFTIRVEGQSMMPLINDGDTVVITPVLPDEVVNNKIYVLHTDEGTLIKRVVVDKKTKVYMLISENLYYSPKSKFEHEIHAFYRVIGRIELYE